MNEVGGRELWARGWELGVGSRATLLMNPATGTYCSRRAKALAYLCRRGRGGMKGFRVYHGVVWARAGEGGSRQGA